MDFAGDFAVELASSAALLGHVVGVVCVRGGVVLVGVVPVVVRDTRCALWCRGLWCRGRLAASKHGSARGVRDAGVLFQ